MFKRLKKATRILLNRDDPNKGDIVNLNEGHPHKREIISALEPFLPSGSSYAAIFDLAKYDSLNWKLKQIGDEHIHATHISGIVVCSFGQISIGKDVWSTVIEELKDVIPTIFKCAALEKAKKYSETLYLP